MSGRYRPWFEADAVVIDPKFEERRIIDRL